LLGIKLCTAASQTLKSKKHQVKDDVINFKEILFHLMGEKVRKQWAHAACTHREALDPGTGMGRSFPL